MLLGRHELAVVRSCRGIDLQHRSLLIDLRIPVLGAGMIAEPTATAATLLLDGLKHVGKIARIITGGRHDTSAEQVCLGLVFAAELKQVHSHALRAHLRCGPNRTTQYLSAYAEDAREGVVL